VIDQGADDTTNAVSIRAFFAKTAVSQRRRPDGDATIIQTRHRIPETPLTEGQVLVYQVPIPEPCVSSSRARPRRARCTRSRNTASCM
jgi:alpha-D-ribose 1-methylphosphonate 5-phosphate C-P lyase